MAQSTPVRAVTTAIVLAGGLGTRLRSAVPDTPKPMAPINGRPFLEHQLDYWIGEGVTDFVLSIGYMHEKISEHFGDDYRGARIRYVLEEEPLGTGGALLAALASVDVDPVLLLNGDTFFEVRLPALAEFHAHAGADWTFALFRTTDRVRYMGMNVDGRGRIHGFEPATPASAGQNEVLANGGVYLMCPRALRSLAYPVNSKLSLEHDIFPAMLAAGAHFSGCEFGGRFIDIGVPADYARAANLLQ